MPIQSCTLPDGGSGYRWGSSGKCYSDRADAEKQAQAAYANGYTGDAALDRIVFDRVQASSRTITADGHMRVVGSAVSKSNVCEYRAEEIPGYVSLGLTPGRNYRLYRDPVALAAAADSLNGKPLTVIHRPLTSDDHVPEVVIGALDNARWEAPYLRADLTIWTQDAIDLVESGEQRQLSCAYRYTPVMRAGVTPDGQAFDGVMTAIEMNHCALVETGRVGPDVFVGDSQPSTAEIIMANHATQSRAALFATGAIHAYLRPKLAKDAKVDLTKVLAGVTGKTFEAQRPKLQIALDAAVKGKLAEDAKTDDVAALFDDLQATMASLAKDEAEDETAADEDDDANEPKKKAAAAQDEDDEPKKPAQDAKPRGISKVAMDAAIAAAVDTAVKAAVTETRAATETAVVARMNAIREAEEAVRPLIGSIAVAQDSAEAVYKLALDGVDLTDVHPSAYRALVMMRREHKAAEAAAPARSPTFVAMDAAAVAKQKERFPNMDRLAKRH